MSTTRTTTRPRLAALSCATLCASLAFAGCGNQSEPSASSSSTTPSSSDDKEWGYSGEGNPETWGDMAPACKDTSTSKESPIDIATADAAAANASEAPQFTYRPGKFELENNGHAIEAWAKDISANTATIDESLYRLERFHFHTGSEHRVDGKAAAGEVHLVHKTESGDTAVLGVFIEVGAANAALDELLGAVPVEAGPKRTDLAKPIDPSQLIPQSSVTYRYDGSLTTPPCTEGVIWAVYGTPLSISAEQLQSLKDAIPQNNRPVQPLHDRTVEQIPAP